MHLDQFVAESFLDGIHKAKLPLKLGELPLNPISEYDSVNQIWYCKNPLLGNNPAGNIEIFNQAALDFFLYDANSLFGKPSKDLTKDDAAQREFRASAISKVMETGESVTFENSNRIRGNGTIVIVPKWELFRHMYKSHPAFGAFLYID